MTWLHKLLYVNVNIVKKLGHPIEFHDFPYKDIIKKNLVFQILTIKAQMNNNSWHIAYCHNYFNKNKSKMEKPCVTKLGHPYC